MRKIIVSGVLLAAGSLFGACAAGSGTTATAPAPTPAAAPAGTAARTVSATNTVENKDGSITTTINYSDGSKSEVRTFRSGRLSTARRETSATGGRVACVTYRADNKEVELKDSSWVDRSMEATGDALVEVADKAEDANDQVKKGAREVGDKAEDVGGAVKKGAKKGARETADKAEDVGDAVKKGAKKTGRAIKKAVNPD